MNKPRLSLQTFTIRKYLKTPDGRAAALGRIKPLGFDAIELARIQFTPKVVDQIAGICRDKEIDVVSTQMKLKEIEADIDWAVKLHRLLGCRDCSVSVVNLGALKSAERLRSYTDRLNRLGGVLKQEGINLLFHHHNFEFVPMNGRDTFRLLVEHLDPDSVQFVLDTYWLQRSGYNPAAFIRNMKGRARGVHLRDYRLKPPIWAPGITDAELGQGNIDFRDVAAAAAEAGCAYMAVEQASAEPWKSLETSINHLKKIGLLGQIKGE